MNNNNQIEVEADELIIKDNIAFLNDKPFNGKATQEYAFITNYGYKEAKDAIWSKFTAYTPYVNGIKQGLCIAYYTNKSKRFEIMYQDGLRNGVIETWYESGKLNEKGTYKKGKRVGLWESWFENESLESQTFYENDKRTEIKFWFENYQLKSEFKESGTYENDKVLITHRGWYNNGQLKYENKLLKKTNQKVRKEWNENGHLIKKETTSSDGQNFLFERTFHKNGIIESERDFKIDYKQEKHYGVGEKTPTIINKPIKRNHGVHKYWSDNGKLSYIKEFRDDKNHGVYKRWHQNGKLNIETYYFDGKTDGNDKWWDARGNLKISKTYNKGQLIEEKRIFKDYYELIFFRIENGYYKKILEYRKHDGQLLPKSEWPKPVTPKYDDTYDSGFNDTYYNDQLDMDQQSPEFWDSL